MFVVGFTGGVDAIYEESQFPLDVIHDASAVLLDNGRIVAGIEEERLDRIKHCNKRATRAIKHCIDDYNINIRDIEAFGFYCSEPYLNSFLREYQMKHFGKIDMPSMRVIIRTVFQQDLDYDLDPRKIMFVDHHVAHAMSTYAVSGFDKSLVVTIDGMGDWLSGSVSVAEDFQLKRLRTFPVKDSLGEFYTWVISLIGYGMFDEYKVMGLAPYGNPERYRRTFNQFYRLIPGGNYEIIDLNQILHMLILEGITPRRKGQPFTQEHKDLAAALQEALENIVLHVVRFYQKKTKMNYLCLAGGVALNCTMNGKILKSGLFEDIFIQPAAHDAGNALGAALVTHQKLGGTLKNERLKHVYWGTDIGNNHTIFDQLSRWQRVVSVQKLDNAPQKAAQLIADGAVIGWVQGRSEFGPRALGNRSIVADPRPAENKDIINAMVKKREAYRPFAPSILEEYVLEYYDVPEHQPNYPFMLFVVKAKESVQSLLGAVTHVDGTARIQTVSKETNERYWRLIDEFRKITGVPVVLNTSFNNNVEPIVNTVDDAITCFLTTGLHYLVVGDYLAEKREIPNTEYLQMQISLPLHIQLKKIRKFVAPKNLATYYECGNTYKDEYTVQISESAYQVLLHVNGEKSLSSLLENAAITDESQKPSLLEEMLQLWKKRVVVMKPV